MCMAGYFGVPRAPNAGRLATDLQIYSITHHKVLVFCISFIQNRASN